MLSGIISVLLGLGFHQQRLGCTVQQAQMLVIRSRGRPRLTREREQGRDLPTHGPCVATTARQLERELAAIPAPAQVRFERATLDRRALHSLSIAAHPVATL